MTASDMRTATTIPAVEILLPEPSSFVVGTLSAPLIALVGTAEAELEDNTVTEAVVVADVEEGVSVGVEDGPSSELAVEVVAAVAS